MVPKAPRRAALAATLLLIAAAPAAAQVKPAADRGALLYDTHCIGCHGTQAHWRDRRLVTDWPSLNAQVRRWQETQRLGWTPEDIAAVAGYLNERFYRFRPVGDAGPAASACSATRSASGCHAEGGRS